MEPSPAAAGALTAASCPTCTSPAIEPTRRDHLEDGMRYQLLCCDNCGLRFWSPLLMPSADYYETRQGPMAHPWVDAAVMHGEGHSKLPAHQYGFFRHFRATGTRLLDIGCGDGTFQIYAGASGYTCVGIDFDSIAVGVARKRGLDVRCASPGEFFGECRAQGQSFDVVTMFDVLEHQAQPLELLEGALSVLRPGGRIAGTVPNRRRLKPFGVDEYDFPPTHFLWFDARSLSRALRQAGFTEPRVRIQLHGFRIDELISRSSRPLKRRMGAQADGRGWLEAGMRRPVWFRALRSFVRVAATPSRVLEQALEFVTGSGASLYYEASRAAN